MCTRTNLGALYYNGQRVKQVDDALATEWFEKAAAQGNITAQYTLGHLYNV
jgi:TPR repeat protein